MKRTTRSKSGRKQNRTASLNKRLSSIMNQLDRDPAGVDWTPSNDRPSDTALARFSAISLLEGQSKQRNAGKLVFDSWHDLPAQALRDITDGYIRRLTIKAGRYRLELVAEKREHKWEFVARIYSGDEIRHDCLVKTTGRKLLPGADGFYHWISASPPRTVEIHTFRTHYEVRGITW